MHTVSVVIITKNEAANIRRCLAAVQPWATEIIVVDSGSTDGTVEICRKAGCNVILTDWQGFGPTKQLGVRAAQGEWVLAIDADEEVSTPLRERILRILKNRTDYSGYRIRERTFYEGKPIRFCGWGNEYHLRLFRKTAGTFNNKQIHESVRIIGKKGTISEPLLHHSYPSRQVHLEKIRRYTDLSARQMHAAGKRAGAVTGLIRGVATFLKMYILKAGVLDGFRGVLVCTYSAYYTYLKYRKLYRMVSV